MSIAAYMLTVILIKYTFNDKIERLIRCYKSSYLNDVCIIANSHLTHLLWRIWCIRRKSVLVPIERSGHNKLDLLTLLKILFSLFKDKGVDEVRKVHGKIDLSTLFNFEVFWDEVTLYSLKPYWWLCKVPTRTGQCPWWNKENWLQTDKVPFLFYLTNDGKDI